MLTVGTASLGVARAASEAPKRRNVALVREHPRVAAAPAIAEPWTRSAYQPSRGQRTVSALAALLLVGGSATALVLLHGATPAERTPAEARLISMPLAPPPPRQPPPPAHRAKVEPPRAQVAAPASAIVIPRQTPAVATAPEPAPPVPVAAPVTAAPAPIAAAAPPAIAEGGNLSARMLSAKPPTYPIESRQHRETGTVTLVVLVATNGTVAEISVAESSGSSRLDQAALGAVRKWRWAPLVRDGQPLMVRGRVRIPFVLKG